MEKRNSEALEVLFVCFGNINRSQIAEALFNRLAKKNHHAASAGIATRINGVYALKDERNNPVVPMAKLGYDLSEARIKKLDEKAVNSAQKVVVLLNREKYESKFPDYLRRRLDLEFWEDVDAIRDDISFEEYCQLESERIKLIEGHVRDLVNRLD